MCLLSQVAHGELTEAPLETLSAVAQHVFLPLLTTSSNQEGWPDVVAKEVSENLHRFVANGAQQSSLYSSRSICCEPKRAVVVDGHITVLVP
jgi:hypothetical protein